MTDTHVSVHIKKLFADARSKGPVEYIYTLVRVDGLEFGKPDPRATLVTTHDSIFPNNDWRIRAEWCD